MAILKTLLLGFISSIVAEVLWYVIEKKISNKSKVNKNSTVTPVV